MALTLVIEWDGPGHPLRVSGPIHDKLACYAMLEGAKDAIRDYVAQNQARVQLAATVPGNGHGV